MKKIKENTKFETLLIKRTSVNQDISIQDTSKPVNQILNLMLWYPDVLPTDILVF